MLQSMTGFGKASAVVADKKITAEVKSLNSKQADLAVRMPQAYREIEFELRAAITKRLQRGKIDLWIHVEPIVDNAAAIINVPLLQQYKAQIEAAAATLNIATPTDWYATLLRLPDALKSESNDSEADEDELQVVRQVVEQALDELVAFRTQEGARLQIFFDEKIAAIGELLDIVPQYEQPRVEKIKARIFEALEKIDAVKYDNNRLEQELIFYIEKLDISEEKLRLANHLKYFTATMCEETVGQGKKLGFIAQEMGREINTLGSKANQAELQKVVVNMKDHLEQIKEQVLNVL